MCDRSVVGRETISRVQNAIVFALLFLLVDCLIFETPEDVVFSGEPATLKCPVDIGEVRWLKDG